MKKLLVSLITVVILVTSISVTSATPAPLFDTTQVESGIVAISFDSGSSSRLKVMVEKNGKKLTYDLKNDGTTESFPLQMGGGAYKVSVLENTQGTKYKYVSTKMLELDMVDDNSVYLASVQNINWNNEMQAIKKATELTAGLITDREKINALYQYLISNVKYDHNKLDKLPTTYLPNIDETFASGKGICYDYSAVLAAMLRSRGIPTKLVKGYSPLVNGYHAWNEIYDSETGEWIIVDSTYDAQMKAAGKKYDMEKKEAQYSMVYEY